MERFYKLYLLVDTREDNYIVHNAIEVIKSRHSKVIIEGTLEAYWRGFPEETLVIIIADEEELVVETVQNIKLELGIDYITLLDQGDMTVI